MLKTTQYATTCSGTVSLLLFMYRVVYYINDHMTQLLINNVVNTN